MVCAATGVAVSIAVGCSTVPEYEEPVTISAARHCEAYQIKLVNQFLTETMLSL